MSATNPIQDMEDEEENFYREKSTVKLSLTQPALTLNATSPKFKLETNTRLLIIRKAATVSDSLSLDQSSRSVLSMLRANLGKPKAGGEGGSCQPLHRAWK